MSTIKINGATFSGNSIVINNGKVIIDGKDQTPDSKEISIVVEGDIDNLMVDCAETVKVKGKVNYIKTQSGDVFVEGPVSGSITTMSGDVDVNGNVASGITSMSGDIKYYKPLDI